MRKILLFIFLNGAMCIFAQQTILLKDGSVIEGVAKTIPMRNIEETTDGIIVSYYFNAFVKTSRSNDNKVSLHIDGFQPSYEKGKPAIPAHWDSVVIPENVSVKLNVIDSSYIDYPLELVPAQQDIPNDIRMYVKDNNEEIEPYLGFYPKKLVSMNTIQSYRGVPILDICLKPIQYDYQNKNVRIYKYIKYKISYTPIKHVVKKSACGYISPNDEFLLNSTINGAKYLAMLGKNTNETKNRSSLLDGYLIVSTNDFFPAVNAISNWKKTLGFDVHTLIRNQWNNPDDVKSAIQTAYDTNNNIKYLLILGGNNIVPSRPYTEYIYGRNRSYVSDLDYGCVHGNDTMPDLLRGRIPARNAADAMVEVNKIIAYERNPTLNTNYYKNGVISSYFQDEEYGNDGYEDRRFVKTSEEIKEYMKLQSKNIDKVYYTETIVEPTHWNNGRYSFGELIPDSLQRSNYMWDGKASDIVHKINDGVCVVLYRGHGYEDKWTEPLFSLNDIDSLSNGQLQPVVFSICCWAGKFNWLSECFCEELLRKPDGGCVAVFGASHSSLSGANDALAEGMINAIWPTPGLIPIFPNVNNGNNQSSIPVFRLGQILDQGIANMKQNWSDSYEPLARSYTQRIFHCFGDPSMMIYTEKPASFSNVTVSHTNGYILVNTGNENARISFHNKNSGAVSCFDGTYAQYPETTDPVVICVSAHNKIPYIVENNIYIQNIITSGTKVYTANQIIVGSEVTNSVPTGSVTFGGNSIKLKAKQITLHGVTSIPVGTNFEITTE